MVKPVIRRKSIGIKVSEEEYARLEALAGGRALGEWVAGGPGSEPCFCGCPIARFTSAGPSRFYPEAETHT